MIREVAEQAFAKMAPVKKQKFRDDPQDQMLAAFENASISDKSAESKTSTLSVGTEKSTTSYVSSANSW